MKLGGNSMSKGGGSAEGMSKEMEAANIRNLDAMTTIATDQYNFWKTRYGIHVPLSASLQR